MRIQFFFLLIILALIFTECQKPSPSNIPTTSDSTATSAKYKWVELTNSTNDFGNGPYEWIFSMCSDNDNNIYAAGSFFAGIDGYFVAKWNGSSWSKIGAGTSALNANKNIFHICCDATGNIYATGAFTNSQGDHYIAKWNGKSWINLGTISSIVGAVPNILGETIETYHATSMVSAGNSVYISFTNYQEGVGGDNVKIYKWDGLAWNECGKDIIQGGMDPVLAVDSGGKLYLACDSTNTSSPYLAEFSADNWNFIKGPNNYLFSTLNSQFVGNQIAGHNSMLANKNGVFFIALSSAGTVSTLRWNSGNWSDLGGSNSEYQLLPGNMICCDQDGNVYVIRYNETALKYFVSKLSGSNWIDISEGISFSASISQPEQIITDKSGNIIVAFKGGDEKSTVFMLKK